MGETGTTEPTVLLSQNQATCVAALLRLAVWGGLYVLNRGVWHHRRHSTLGYLSPMEFEMKAELA